MKKLSIILIFLLGINFAHAFYIPDDVRKEIGGTFSTYQEERTVAAYQLGEMGPRAVRAIPFLIRILDDKLPVWHQTKWHQINSVGIWTSPGEESAKALAKIGKPALTPLVTVLENKHPYVKGDNPYVRKNAMLVLIKITGKDFGAGNTEKYLKWIEENFHQD